MTIPHQRAVSRLIQITWNYWVLKRTKVRYPPYRLWIEPTNRCNLACVMCPNRELKKEELGFMDFELYQSLIDQSCGFVHDINLHHRGESTLHPQLVDMIRYGDQKGVKIKLHTNGTTLTKELSESLIKSGLRLISFSFDGYTPETYEKIRVRAHFQRTIQNIHRFLEIKKKLNSTNPRVVMEIMEFDENPLYPDAKKSFIASLKARGLNRLILKKPHNWAGNIGLNTFESSKFSVCTFPWHALVVLWDGRVGACPHDFFGKIIYGNVHSEPLSQIFNNQQIQNLRAQMLKGSFDALNPPCKTCDSVRRKRFSGIPIASMRYLRD